MPSPVLDFLFVFEQLAFAESFKMIPKHGATLCRTYTNSQKAQNFQARKVSETDKFILIYDLYILCLINLVTGAFYQKFIKLFYFDRFN